MPSVEVRNLRKTYNGVHVVDDVSFTVPDGSCTSLLGPSGCGKTTTLRMLAGFERPDGGSILIGGKPMAGAGASSGFVPANQRNIGFVFQSYALWPHMQVFDQVAYPLRVRRLARGADLVSRVTRALEQVELASMMQKYPSQLSGGQQQRVALARALVFEPSVILLDEPLSNLDAGLRNQMRGELAALHARLQATFVYVTHDKAEALALSDQVLVMRTGKIIENGRPESVYGTPTSAYAAKFVAGANCLAARVVEGIDSRVLVDVGGGFKLLGTDCRGVSARSGDTVVALIKPEHIRVNDDRAVTPGANVLVGKVLSSTYLGSHDEIRVTVSGLPLVNVHAPPQTGIDADQTIAMYVPEDRVRVVAADDVI